LDKERLGDLARDQALYLHVWEGECGTTGECFFPIETLHGLRHLLRKPKARGELSQVGRETRFLPRVDGWLHVYEMPADLDYVIAADVSQGKSDGDRSVAQVLIRDTLAEQVARVAPRCDPDEYARRCVLTAQWYQRASSPILGIERNGMGLAATIAARDTGYRGLYVAKDREVGVLTTPASRPVFLADLAAMLRDGQLVIRSEETYEELQTFVTTPSGRPEAAPGCHDDEVMSLAIGAHLLRNTGPMRDSGFQYRAECSWQ